MHTHAYNSLHNIDYLEPQGKGLHYCPCVEGITISAIPRIGGEPKLSSQVIILSI